MVEQAVSIAKHVKNDIKMNPMEKGVSNAKNKLRKCHGNDPLFGPIYRNTSRYDTETPNI